MTIVRTFADLVPLEREDDVPWTQIEIAQAADEGGRPGAWTTLEVQMLPDPDADPAHPAVRTITTSLGTLDPAWFRFRWLDATTSVSEWTQPSFTGDQQGYRPSVTEVAMLLRARTKQPRTGGRELGTFTAETRPTADEVEALIDEAIDEVRGKVNVAATTDDAAGYERRVRGAVRLYAAMLVELSYYPEQIRNNDSPYTAYQALYNSRVKALIVEAETGHQGGFGDSGSGSDAPADAAWWFPEDDGGLVGWQSGW